MQKLKIALILGTTRSGRRSENAARLIEKVGQDYVEIELTYVDPKDFPPFSNLKTDQDYEDIVINADAFFIVTPEYNHGYPGDLKILLDKQLKNYIHKPVAFAGVSTGQTGGARAIETLIGVVRELGLQATFTDVLFSNVKDLFDKDGNLLDQKILDNIHKSYVELIWMAKAMKWGRENLN